MSAPRFDLETLSKYFHLPINDVAKELGVCATVLKKICRKSGIPRWPHRKIKSLDKMISSLEKSSAKNPEDQLRITQELETLKNKRDFLMRNPIVLAGDKKSLPSGKPKDKVIKKKIRSSDSSSYSSAPSSPMSKSFDSEGSRSSDSAMELESMSLNKIFEVFSRLQQKQQIDEARATPVIPMPVNVSSSQSPISNSPKRQLLEPSTRSAFLALVNEESNSDPLMQLASLSEFELVEQRKSSPVSSQPSSPTTVAHVPFVTLPPLPVQKPIPGSMLFFPSIEFRLVDRNNTFAFAETSAVSPLACNFMQPSSNSMIHVE